MINRLRLIQKKYTLSRRASEHAKRPLLFERRTTSPPHLSSSQDELHLSPRNPPPSCHKIEHTGDHRRRDRTWPPSCLSNRNAWHQTDRPPRMTGNRCRHRNRPSRVRGIHPGKWPLPGRHSCRGHPDIAGTTSGRRGLPPPTL